MAVPLAQVDDVAVIWRALEAGEIPRVTQLISIASAKLRSKVPFDLDARMALYATSPGDAAALDPVVVANVVATMVKRVLVNPDGLASSTQAFGPISESRTFANATETDIQVTAADLAELMPQQPSLRVGVRSAQLGLSPSMRQNRHGWRDWAWRGNYTPPSSPW